MATQTTNNGGLSHIDNIDALNAELSKVKHRIKQRENDIADRWRRLPQESMKAALGAAIPVFLENKLSVKTFQIARSLISFFVHKRKNEREIEKDKTEIKNTVKQLGLYAAVRTIFSLLKRKH